MAIKLPDPGNGIPEQKTGNDEWTNMKIVRDNFADQSNAASRLVGTATGNVVEMKEYGVAGTGVGGKGKFGIPNQTEDEIDNLMGGYFYRPNAERPDDPDMKYLGPYDNSGIVIPNRNRGHGGLLYFPSQIANNRQNILFYQVVRSGGEYVKYYHVLYTSRNTTKDSNGMIKASSPVLRVFSDRIEGNDDGERMGAKFVKKGVGNYLIKGTTGLADEGWYVTVPQDANGNNLVAVEYESLENGDVVLRTYKRKFDFETVRIVADHDNPLDIPETRWVDLRFNDLPEEPTDEPAI